MRVFLITSPLGRPEPPVYPLGLASLVPYLSAHAVAGYDCNLAGRSIEEGYRRAADFGADVIAFSLRNVDTTQERDLYTYYPAFVRAVARARELFPQATLAAGGAAFSLYPREIMEENAALDVGVYLEGEEAFAAALRAPVVGEGAPSVIYRRNGELVVNDPGRPVDVAAALAPDRVVFPLSDYRDEPFAVGVQTRRGCPCRCAYCTYPALEGHVIRSRGVENVMIELEALRDAGLSDFTFVDAVWSAPAPRAKEICRQMIARRLGMRWKAYFDEKTFDGELADLALEAGVDEFTFSPDAADDDVLAALGKGITTADVYATLDVLEKRRRARVSYSFFINPPGQTARSFLATVRFYFAARRRLGHGFLGASFGNIRVGPQTPIYDEARKNGKVKAGLNMLPRTAAETRKLFYHNIWPLRFLSAVYNHLWRIKKAASRWLRRS